MYIELHLLQNFAPSCLNRDDTNTPKDCMFGGFRRARISSQCIKRAIRVHTKNAGKLDDDMGTRTKRLVSILKEKLIEKKHEENEIESVIEAALQTHKISIAKKTKAQKESDEQDEYKTQYVLFLGKNEIDLLCQAISDHWDTLKRIADENKEQEKTEKKNKKNEKKNAFPKEVKEAIEGVFKGKKASDVSLFGRMVADAHHINVDAACQVAHAISTHKIEMEMDFFTAVDDLQPEDNAGADMMGIVEFNSACFYRYAVIDREKLEENLGKDEDLTKKTIEAFLRASIEAIPTGKQNTFAAHNPPGFIMAVVRDGVPWSLANAFEIPVRPNDKGLCASSIEKLDTYWGQLIDTYDGTPNVLAWTSLDPKPPVKKLGDRKENAESVIQAVMEVLS